MISLDPLGFTLQALSARGALVEEAAGEAIAIVPPEVARELELDEEARIALDAGARGAVSCGLGTPLLERLLAAARARVPVAAVDIDAEPARPVQARVAAERLVVRNGLRDVVDVTPGDALYVAATIAWVAEADDRWEGSFTLVGECASGAAPDDNFAALLNASRAAARRPTRHAAPAEAAAWIGRRAMMRAREAMADIQGSVARRLGRDHTRIVDYFAALIAESQRPRRPTAPETIAAKVAQLVAERDAKLRDLATRYALRVALTPAALVIARTRVMNLQLHLRRRKGARDIVARLPAGASRPDALACEGCPDATTRPVLCDDRLHILCERCVPSAQGRPRCPACAGAK